MATDHCRSILKTSLTAKPAAVLTNPRKLQCVACINSCAPSAVVLGCKKSARQSVWFGHEQGSPAAKATVARRHRFSLALSDNFARAESCADLLAEVRSHLSRARLGQLRLGADALTRHFWQLYSSRSDGVDQQHKWYQACLLGLTLTLLAAGAEGARL